MNKKDIILKTLEIVGGNYEDKKSYDEKRLNSSIDMILTEIAEEYSPTRHKEILPTNNGEIKFSDFNKPVKEILSVKIGGRSVDFTVEESGLKVAGEGNAEVTFYSHAENPQSETEEIKIDRRINPTAVSYGAASEYYMRGGFVEEALFYKNRYDTSIINLTKSNSNFYIKRRRFI